MIRFLIAGEGLTDYIVLKNILIGFFRDKNLPISRLIPKDKEPVGWGNVLRYLATSEFRDGVINTDYIIIQIDTDKCEDWNEGLHHIGDNADKLDDFIREVIAVLVKKIGSDFYDQNKSKFLFAISIHEMECWLLPFIADRKAHWSKIVGCVNAIEWIAQKQGISINQKNYEDGKHYEKFSKDMKNHSILTKNYSLNPSLRTFVDMLKAVFPPPQAPQPDIQEPEQA